MRLCCIAVLAVLVLVGSPLHACAAIKQVRVKAASANVTITGSKTAKDVTGSGQIQRDGDHVTVRSVGSSAILLTVPASVSVRVKTASGSIRVVDVAGDIRVRSYSGSVDVKNARRKVTVDTASGCIEILGAPEVDAKSMSGNIRAQGRLSNIRVISVSGDVVAKQITGRVDIKSVSGDVRIDTSGDDFDGKIRTHSGNVGVRVGNNKKGFRYRFVSFSGDLTLAAGRVAGTLRVRRKAKSAAEKGSLSSRASAATPRSS
jgi:DUF4097 and DUF4098 domain-containing protein YvlB